MRRTLLGSLATVIVLALLAIAALLLLGRPLIRLLFERGRFDAAAGDLTYQVLTIYAIGLPAYVITEVVSRGLIALRDTRTPLLTNTAQLLGRIVIFSLLLDQVGVLAIPAAFAITASLESIALTVILLLRLRRRIATIRTETIGESYNV